MQGYLNRLAVFDLLLGLALTVIVAWALLGTCLKLYQWASTPSPLPIPLTPAPRTRFGVVVRLLAEIVLFRALAKANRVTWLASVFFHYGLLFVLIMHVRFFTASIPSSLLPFIVWSGWAALAMLLGLCVLLIRRIVVDRYRYISTPSDYLHLLLLISIGLSGAALKRLWPVDTFGVGEFLRGALTLQWQALPNSVVLVVHLALVLLLFFVFPISKLLHGVGIVFSPTLNERDTSARLSSKGKPSQ